MRIVDILKQNRPVFSFEFFPPKNPEDEAALLETAAELRRLEPDFVSVTWGAGGSTQRKTLEITSAIKQDLGVETMAHLTCVGASRGEIDQIISDIIERGIENIMALRGDPPRGQTNFVPHADGYLHADELVRHIVERGDFCVGVAGYPERHPESPDDPTDLRYLKRKLENGAHFVTTQLFFDTGLYFRFVERARSSGISVPILPGVMPVTNVKQIKRFTGLCGASIPDEMLARLEALQDDAEGVIHYGIEYATRQCEKLLAGGAPGVHFYTLNRSRSTSEILKNLKSHSASRRD